MEKNTFGKVLKQFCAVILSAVLIFNSFAFTVYAFDEPDITQGGDIQAEEQENGVDVEDVENAENVENPVDSEEPEDESGFIADLVITGFVELLPEVAVIYIDKLDSIDDALALLPAALKVTAVTGEVSEIIDLPVTWSCAEPFEEAPKDEYVFLPSWDETAYALSPELDLSTVVTVTVRVGEAPVEEDVEEEVEEEVEGDEEPLPMANRLIEFSEGSGTEADPFLIKSVAELRFLENNYYLNTSTKNKFYKLTIDIDLQREQFQPPTAVETYFKGCFDGDGHTISNLKINSSSALRQGLFGATDEATIKNLKLENVDISADVPIDDLTTNVSVGGLIGYALDTSIENCSVSGTVSGNKNVGGLIGVAVGSTMINCSVSGTVSGKTFAIGGLVGAAGNKLHNRTTSIANCFSNADINVTFEKVIGVGGVVGELNLKETLKISNSYASGKFLLAGEGPQPDKGIGGIGGIVGNAPASIYLSNCYWAKDTATNSIGNYTYSGSCRRFDENGKLVDKGGNPITASVNGKACANLHTALTEWLNVEKSSDFFSWEVSPDTSQLPSFGTEWAEIKPTSLKLSYDNKAIDAAGITLKVGRAKTLKANILPEGTTDATVIWNVSNKSVAKISDKGVVTGLATGNTEVTARVGDVTARCNVKVEAVAADTSEVEIFLNVDEQSGYTFEEVEAMLKEKLDGNVRILSNRQDINTTDLRDWYVYDHYDTDANCWKQTDANTNGVPDEWEDAYKDSLHRSYYPYTEGHSLGSARPPVYTIEDWIDNKSYIVGSAKMLAKFKEHIYSRVGSDGKPSMIFAGYGKDNVMDFLFYDPDSKGKKFVDFDVDSSKVETHTLRGTGFLVNCGIDKKSPVPKTSGDTISGYLVYYSYINGKTSAGAVSLYKLSNVPVDKIHGPSPGSSTNKDYPLGLFEKLITVPIFEWDNNMSVQIVAEPTKIEVRQQPKASKDNIASQDPIISEVVSDFGLSGFGPLVDYSAIDYANILHTCTLASSFIYSNLRMAFIQGVAATSSTLLDSYKYADFTQDIGDKKVQRYFLNFLGNAPVDYNDTENGGFSNYEAYLKLMQEENVALITDKSTPFDEYLGSNLHEETTPPSSLQAFVENVSDYLGGKTNTVWNTDQGAGSKPSGSTTPVANPYLTSGGIQVRNNINANNITSENPLKIKIEDACVNASGDTVKRVYTIRKPGSLIFEPLTLSGGYLEITNNTTDFPVGKYTIELTYKDNNDNTIGISGYSYFTLVRPEPGTYYSVIYNANGGSGAPYDSNGYIKDERVTLLFPESLKRNGFAFVGWSTDPTSVTAEYMAVGPTNSLIMHDDVTLYAVWAEQYAVIYNTMGGSSISPVEKLNIDAKAPKPPDPVRAGYIFDGWYKEETCENPWDFDTDTIIGNTTLYAKWTQLPPEPEQPRPKIDGITSYPGGTIAPRANVRLVKGNTEFGNTTADESGYYSFHNIPVGYYNAIITLGEHIVTKLVQVTNPTFFEDKATIPPMLENSVVAIGVNSPEIVVGKIDHLFGIQTADGYSTVDKELVMRGGKAQMTMSIEEKAKADMNLSQKQQAHEISIKATENKKMVDSYFDFTLSKNVGSNSIYFEQGKVLTESFLLLPIIIPLSHELRGYSEFEVYRYHSGRVDIISAVPNENGEYLSWDGESLFIYAKGFSMYALTVPMKNTQPQTGSSALPIPIMPVAAAAMTLFMAKFLLWQYEFEIGISQEERDRMVTALIDWAKGTTAIKIGVAIVCLAFVFASYNLRRFISKVIRSLGKDA